MKVMLMANYCNAGEANLDFFVELSLLSILYKKTVHVPSIRPSLSICVMYIRMCAYM